MKKRNIVLLSLAALIVLAVTYSLTMRFYYQHQFNQRVAELKAQGFPVSLDDLEKAYTLPAGTPNAADIYIEAFSHYVEPNEAEKELLPYVGSYELTEENSELPPAVLKAISSFLDKNRQTLELLDKASTIETCLWPKTRQDCMLSNEHFRQIKDAAKLLHVCTLYHANVKEIEDLFRAVNSSIALANSIQTQSFLLDHLVRLSIKNISMETLYVAMDQTSFESQQLDFLQKKFAWMQGYEDLHNAFIIDRIFEIEFVPLSYQQQKENYTGMPPYIICFLHSASGLYAKDSFFSLLQSDKYLEASKLPLDKRSAAFQTIADDDRGFSLFHFFYENIVTYRKLNDIDLRVIGSLRCAETACALERYRLKHGAVPESLDALVPEFIAEVPREPFDNQPLRYIRHDVGYTVYTIGEDAVDNGGLSYKQMRKLNDDKNPEQYDWPFTVRR